MLALTRKVDQGIVINGNIEIKVLDVQDGKVKLGISAPKEVSIHREEIYLEIQEANKAAMTSQEDTVRALQQMIGIIVQDK